MPRSIVAWSLWFIAASSGCSLGSVDDARDCDNDRDCGVDEICDSSECVVVDEDVLDAFGECGAAANWTITADASICAGYCSNWVVDCHPTVDCRLSQGGQPAVLATCSLAGDDGTAWCDRAVPCLLSQI